MKKPITVNGREMRVAGKYLTFEDLVRFACFTQPDRYDTVTYYCERGPRLGGVLRAGQEVPLEANMHFRVERRSACDGTSQP